MFRQHRFIHILLFILIALPLLSVCAALTQPVTTSGAAPTPVVAYEKGGVDNPDVFVDPAAFQAALLKALVGRDTAKLQMWMTMPFLTSSWRGDGSDSAPAEAIDALYAQYLADQPTLTLVKGADLKALMGGKDPLSYPRSEAGVIDVVLVSGWGKDGRDEAILFIARQTDNSLKWHGWMVVKGGFSGARLGGIQAYTNDAHGYNLYLPKDFEVQEPGSSSAFFLGPGAGHPSDERAGVFIQVEPAGGRTAEQVAARVAGEAKAAMGAGYTGGTITVLGIDSEAAYAVDQLPGQDFNRQLFIVHHDLLYSIMFIPDNPRGGAYLQMEDAYAMITNTLHFTK